MYYNALQVIKILDMNITPILVPLQWLPISYFVQCVSPITVVYWMSNSDLIDFLKYFVTCIESQLEQ